MALPRGSVRGVSFDYGHVLGGIDLDELARRIAAHGPAASVPRIRESMPDAYRAHDAAIARGEGHEAGWKALMGHMVGAGVGAFGGAPGVGVIDSVHLTGIVQALWDRQPQSNLWRFVPDEARALLLDLDARGVPMVITSNSEGRVAELAEEVGIARHFRRILDSGRLGFGKPDRRIFDLARESLAVPMEAMVHVGDSEKADVIGAKDAGALAIRFDAFLPFAGPDSRADVVAKTFAELRVALFEALGLD
jgi:putative hydrolase of the HAD superfamily